MKSSAALLLLALIAAHLLLRAGLGFDAGSPDLALVAVLAGSRLMTIRAAAATGFVVGLMEDALAMNFFGTGTLATTLAGAGGARLRDFFVGESLPFLTAYFLIGKWGRDLLAWAASGPARPEMTPAMVVDSLLAAAYAAGAGVVVLFCFPVLSKARR